MLPFAPTDNKKNLVGTSNRQNFHPTTDSIFFKGGLSFPMFLYGLFPKLTCEIHYMSFISIHFISMLWIVE